MVKTIQEQIEVMQNSVIQKVKLLDSYEVEVDL